MGLSSKTSKTTSHTEVKPTNPTQVTNGLTGFADQITNLQNRDPSSFTVAANPLQSQAAGLAGSLGMYDNQAGAAMNSQLDDAYGSLSKFQDQPGARALTYMNDYMDPYLNAVVNTSLANYDTNAARQSAQAQLDLAQDTAQGGSGGSLYKAMLAREQGDGRASLDSSLRSQGWNTALGAGQQDAGNEMQQRGLALQAAQSMGQLANDRFNNTLNFDANNRANVGAQMQAGDDMRQIDLQRQLAPLTAASAISGLWGSTPFGLMQGQISDSTSKTKVNDPIGGIAGLAGGLGALGMGLGGLGLNLFGGAAGAAGAVGGVSQGLADPFGALAKYGKAA